jgi:hypothetical protein
MIWPFVQTDLTGNTKLNFYGPGIYHEARCVDENEFYGRSELYPGWKCLIDLDCHSNKCVKGKCIGKKLYESCQANIDCESGMYCETAVAPPACYTVKPYNASCTSDGQCEAGAFCNQNTYCDYYFYKKAKDRMQDARQCYSGMFFFEVNGYFCETIGETKYGPFRNTITNYITF